MSSILHDRDFRYNSHFLQQQLFNLLLDGLDLRLDLGPLVLSDAVNKILSVSQKSRPSSYLAAMTGLLTPQALPSACLDLTNT